MHEHASIGHQSQSSPAAMASDVVPAQETNKPESELVDRFPIQLKLSVGATDDPLEHEADAMADKVMRMPDTSFIQRKCSCADHDDEHVRLKPLTSQADKVMRMPDTSFIQRKCSCADHDDEHVRLKSLTSQVTPFIQAKGDGAVSNSVSSRIQSSMGGGQQLDGGTKSFMESRFGADFSDVKIHNGSESAELNRSLNAKAFTVSNNIYFNSGQYKPETDTGKHLLAHELTHVVQQQQNIQPKLIQCCQDTATNTQFDAVANQVRARAEYRSLRRADRAVADQIITITRARNDCMYFINRLLTLFETPVDQSTARGTAASGMMATAAQDEQARLATPEGSRLSDLEERTVADPARARHWETIQPRAGSNGAGTNFRIDRADVNNIAVQVKIRLTGNSADVANIQAQEDGIEKAAQQMGYILDVIFVRNRGRDVFEVGIHPAQAVTSRNWSAYSANPGAYTHEIHHLLGLEDRYDYTDHARNPTMNLHDRLHWFRIQAGHPFDPHVNESIMGRGNELLDDDICNVTRLNFANCMASRQTRRNALNTARTGAFVKTFRVFQSLSNLSPGSAGEMMQLRRRAIISKANLIFGSINDDQLFGVVTTIRDRLTPGVALRFAPDLDSNCTNSAYYVIGMTPPIVICNNFFGLNDDDKIKTYLRAAAHLAHIDSAAFANSSSAFDCSAGGGSFNNADTWSKFIWCASDL